jgi:hypothetical protein
MRLPDHLFRTLEWSFSGPGEDVLPDHALHGLRVRITPRWWDQAACLGTDPEAWFPDATVRPEPVLSRICAGCPVRKSCLATAVLADEEGIWGGTRRGQRLHARARLLNDEEPGNVLGDLLASPLPRSEYAIPDTIPTPTTEAQPEAEVWKEAS